MQYIVRNGFGIEQQTPDQGAFAVVDGAGGYKLENIHFAWFMKVIGYWLLVIRVVREHLLIYPAARY
jgi:hypothetical protein